LIVGLKQTKKRRVNGDVLSVSKDTMRGIKMFMKCFSAVWGIALGLATVTATVAVAAAVYQGKIANKN
jgi:hypothetical protein